MKLPYPKRKRLEPLPDVDEREAHKFGRRYAEDQGSIRAVFKKMGRTNLDGPFKRG
jgi:hypothetical protein